MKEDFNKETIVEMTVEVVSAYVSNNRLTTAELPDLLSSVYESLGRLVLERELVRGRTLKPAIPIEGSITPEYIVCLEDGKKFKSLRRHLRTHYDLSPEEYREKWGLPVDYPMVAPNYASRRSELAKKMGLGQQTRKKKSSLLRG